jgi:hypothetical protein
MQFQQELIAGILATVIGGLILALLTGSGRASRFLRFVLIAGILVAVGALVLAQMRGSGRRWRGDAPVNVHLTATLPHACAAHIHVSPRRCLGV